MTKAPLFAVVALLLQACASASSPVADAGCEAALCDAGQEAGPPDGGPDGGSLDGGADGGSPDGGRAGGPRLSLALHRGSGGSPSTVLAFVSAFWGDGGSAGGLDLSVLAGDAGVAAIEDGGVYLATVVPPFASGELPLHVLLAGVDAGIAATALILPIVGAAWDQPIPVPGLVDNLGTQDSPTISPDGQWLMVATYSPVDIFCCITGCGHYPLTDGDNPVCSDVLGPIAAPARPGMPGADRIVSPTQIDFADPTMCVAEADGGPLIYFQSDGGQYPFALPPVASYGFHRQADGSFAEPFLIDTGSDGYLTQPVSFAFLGLGDAGDAVPVIFGYNVDRIDGGPIRPWFGRLTLGQSNALGSYACEGPEPGFPAFTADGISPLPIGPAYQQAGNTSVAAAGQGGFYLFSDDESATPPFVEFSFADGGGGYTPWTAMALPNPSDDRRQPFAFDGRVFYFQNANIASVAWDGGDPGSAASFWDPEIELGTTSTGRVGEAAVLGQPTLAAMDGGIQMFFEYYVRTATGARGEVATVWLR